MINVGRGIILMLVAGVLTLSSCKRKPVITEVMLDGNMVFDPSLLHPEGYLVSYSAPTPSAEEQEKPIIIAAHGYTATTFEWDEFRKWNGSESEVQVSQVLLGGHGRTYEDFIKASWKDWQMGIVEEYNRLNKAGYKNLNLVGSSTGGTLILEMLASGFFEGKVAPNNIILIDPLVVPANKMLSLVKVLGPFVGYMEEEQGEEEDKVFYHFRPYQSLVELNEISEIVRDELEKGIVLPKNTQLKVYKSKRDQTVDPISAELIFQGVKTNDGKEVEVEMVDSDLHVFTRLALRDSVSEADKKRQIATFKEIKSRVWN
ncbi:alpha/beta hydrolase [Xanthovirga aplysinae]|uniref:alpha/beta hydrolase n=1 Tax=Xanthovirga aplysinae TaxID=2529853 RepID=UPI0012BBA47B|nr:steryl acetyl hydrolase [Xanthovirga aplysinae]MTI31504.1 steryl acetyl hydrolase [Xanthovirga aplysinae]